MRKPRDSASYAEHRAASAAPATVAVESGSSLTRLKELDTDPDRDTHSAPEGNDLGTALQHMMSSATADYLRRRFGQ